MHNGRSKMNKDKSMNIDTETYKKWISDPDSVKDIIRQPNPVPRNREEECVCEHIHTHTHTHTHTQAKMRRYQGLATQGQLVETLLKEPSQVCQ